MKQIFTTQYIVRLSILAGIIILMAFTPLGYFKTLGLSVTFIQIPVIVGGIAMGPIAGAILGAIFGLTSFIQCFGLEPFGTALLGISFFGTLITCLVPRILMGWISALIFRGLQLMGRKDELVYPVTCLAGALLNTILFMFSLLYFFYESEYLQGFAQQLGTNHLFTFFLAFVGISGLVEALVCCLAGTGIAKALPVIGAKWKR